MIFNQYRAAECSNIYISQTALIILSLVFFYLMLQQLTPNLIHVRQISQFVCGAQLGEGYQTQLNNHTKCAILLQNVELLRVPFLLEMKVNEKNISSYTSVIGHFKKTSHPNLQNILSLSTFEAFPSIIKSDIAINDHQIILLNNSVQKIEDPHYKRLILYQMTENLFEELIIFQRLNQNIQQFYFQITEYNQIYFQVNEVLNFVWFFGQFIFFLFIQKEVPEFIHNNQEVKIPTQQQQLLSYLSQQYVNLIKSALILTNYPLVPLIALGTFDLTTLRFNNMISAILGQALFLFYGFQTLEKINYSKGCLLKSISKMIIVIFPILNFQYEASYLLNQIPPLNNDFFFKKRLQIIICLFIGLTLFLNELINALFKLEEDCLNFRKQMKDIKYQLFLTKNYQRSMRIFFIYLGLFNTYYFIKQIYKFSTWQPEILAFDNYITANINVFFMILYFFFEPKNPLIVQQEYEELLKQEKFQKHQDKIIMNA